MVAEGVWPRGWRPAELWGRGPQSWGGGATYFLWKSGMLKSTWTTELR